MTYTAFLEQENIVNNGVSKFLEIVSANSSLFQYSTLVVLSANILAAKTMWDGKISTYLKDKEYLKLAAHACFQTSWHLAMYAGTAIAFQQNIFSNPTISTAALLGFTALSSVINIFSVHSAIKNYFAEPTSEINVGNLRLENYFLSGDLMKVNYNIPDGTYAIRSVLEVVKPNETEEEIRRLALNSSGIASLSDASQTAFQNVSLNGTRISLEIPLKKGDSIVSEVIEHIERKENGSWVELTQRQLFSAQQEPQGSRSL